MWVLSSPGIRRQCISGSSLHSIPITPNAVLPSPVESGRVQRGPVGSNLIQPSPAAQSCVQTIQFNGIRQLQPSPATQSCVESIHPIQFNEIRYITPASPIVVRNNGELQRSPNCISMVCRRHACEVVVSSIQSSLARKRYPLPLLWQPHPIQSIQSIPCIIQASLAENWPSNKTEPKLCTTQSIDERRRSWRSTGTRLLTT